ncbi:MAG: PAS domain S-box protein [Acidobacteria bacterium]|nr:PAS domain S-box protein [Acidobacteriota bacterium]
MDSTGQIRHWLSWLLKVRVLLIAFLLGAELVIRQFAPSPVPLKFFLSLILLWVAVSVVYGILRGLDLNPYLQAYVELTGDLVLVTGLVYVTGSLDSYFVFLYLLVIIMASILLSRVGAFLVAALSFILFAAIVDASYFKVIPVLYPQSVGIWPLQVYLGINLLAFFGVWYLSSYLAESLRTAGVELQDKRGELEDLQAFNENIIQSMRGGLLTTDLRGRILVLNPAGEEILGVEQHRARGARLGDRFPSLARLLPASGENPNEARQEVRASSADGREKILGVSLSLLRTREGTQGGYVYNFQDLTELKRLEAEVAQKERMAALGRMAAAIAHEIRNPLGAIAGSVRQLARYAEVGEDEQKLVEIVTRESERLNRVVNDILTYSKEKVVHRERVNLVPLLEETLLLLERHPQFNSSIRVEKYFPPKGVQLEVDPGQMKQVMWNLCDNALRAMPAGGTLRIGVEKVDGLVRIRVADTGVGLTPEQCEKIFEPFESSFVGGTGLGLAIVCQIVGAHRGRVWAQPGRPSGSEFTVELPAR